MTNIKVKFSVSTRYQGSEITEIVEIKDIEEYKDLDEHIRDYFTDWLFENTESYWEIIK